MERRVGGDPSFQGRSGVQRVPYGAGVLAGSPSHGPLTLSHRPQVLRMMVGVNISDEQLGSIADRTIQEADQNGDSSISFNEFIKVTFPCSLNERIPGNLSLFP